MSALNNQPTNPSFLSPLGFKLQIKRAPSLNFFIQKVNLPGVTLGTADVETPFSRIPFPGTKLTFGNLDVTFKVDEDMRNYLEMYAWLRSIGFPDSFTEYKNVSSAAATLTGEGVTSDISLLIQSSAMNPNIEVTFFDCFPVDLSQIEFDSTSVDVEYVTATVSFANRRFEIKQLP
jgi:hypothetical protein